MPQRKKASTSRRQKRGTWRSPASSCACDLAHSLCTTWYRTVSSLWLGREKGYEVQVNNSQSDWRRTAGLYGIDYIKQPQALHNQWFAMVMRGEGKHITVSVDGKQVIDYTEPDGVERSKNFAGRLLDRGTFALQVHDPGSEVWYKDIRVKPLPE